MNNNFKNLSLFDVAELEKALSTNGLEMALGPFSMRVRGQERSMTAFLMDAYRDTPVRLALGDVTDVSVKIRAPNIFRKFVRRQIIPDPGFIVPAVPLPPRLSPLALEMGLNLAIALKCCRFVTLHAGVVANSKGAILISANSGGGKSTLAAALMENNYQLFSDEFGLLDMSSANLHAYPRPVSLKGKSIDIVRELAGPEWLTETLTGTPKGEIAYRRVRPTDIKGALMAVPAKLLLFPKFAEGAKPRVKEIPKAEALMKLIPSSTNYHLLGASAFSALVQMVSGARAYEISYGTTEDSLLMAQDLAAGAGL